MLSLKNISAIVLNLAIIISLIVPTFAEDTPEYSINSNEPIGIEEIEPSEKTQDLLPFTVELCQSFEGYSIKGTLKDISTDMVSIIPCYSFDGENYIPEEYNKWEIYTDMQTQQCFWESDIPLKEFLDKKENSIYFKLKITYEDNTVVWTQANSIVRDLTIKPLPDDYLVQAWYDSPIRIIKYSSPPEICGQYNFTVSDTATTEDLMALLPEQIPIELQISQSSQSISSEVVEYTAKWQANDIVLNDKTAEIATNEITLSDEITVYIGTNLYRIQDVDSILFNASELRATFNRISSDTPSEVLLSTDGFNGVKATLPLKPTSATSIIPEYSLDGGTNWIALPEVLSSCPLETEQPKEPGYTVRILDGNSAPMKD
ncbi:MAG: hypothetical protein RR263_04100, partial [Oscillospiraceae bacterium]